MTEREEIEREDRESKILEAAERSTQRYLWLSSGDPKRALALFAGSEIRAEEAAQEHDGDYLQALRVAVLSRFKGEGGAI